MDVRDAASNPNENIEWAARAIGSGGRRMVFEAIYNGKKRIKTVAEIAKATGLDRKRILTEAQKLVSVHVVEKAPRTDGDTAYRKVNFLHSNKAKILSLASNPAKLAAYPTKRKSATGVPIVIVRASSGQMAKRISIDDVKSFSKVKRIKGAGSLPKTMSESEFKIGVQSVIGQKGTFKDWGGEKSDLFTTKLYIGAKRYAAAFAFKGPGLKAKLVPGKMGKNGDQMQRLFNEDAEVFLVQHWREIDPSVLDLMRSMAVAKSVLTGSLIRYGIIDGEDSERLRLAYPTKFKMPSANKKIVARKRR